MPPGKASTPSLSTPAPSAAKPAISDRIDNYPGFPDGISGAELADRFVAQARRYGVELLSAVAVTAVEPDGDDLVTTLSSGQNLTSHAVIVATGSTYRRLDVPGEEDLIGAGVHFCATCDGPFYKGADEVVVIGGGNSALEEGLHLSEFAKKVRVLAHSGLSASPAAPGPGAIRPAVPDPHRGRHRRTRRRAGPLCRRRGPRSGRRRDPAVPGRGGLRVHRPRARTTVSGPGGRAGRRRFPRTSATMETSMAGVFAAGDVRSGSTKQLGSAVGDGIAALLMARRYLQEHGHKAAVLVDN